jgi:hypothetical protein
MRSLIRKVLGARAQGPWILASAVLVALIVAPMAGAFGDGKTLRGGARNPSSDARKAYSKETEIIASVSTYGTRQSNKSSNGGGAVYGCRSGPGGTPKGNEPCIRANNLASGLAFEFNSTNAAATQVGSITATNSNAAPFTTNATGVATGLNADKVDGKDASDLQAKFAEVAADGTLAAGARGAKTVSHTAGSGNYSVDFDSDVSKCARAATITGATAGEITTEAADADTVTVHTFDSAGGAAERAFHLVVTC